MSVYTRIRQGRCIAFVIADTRVCRSCERKAARPEGEAVCEVYDDDGRSLAYERGEYRLTRIICTINDGVADVRREVVHDGYSDELRFISLRVHAPVEVVVIRLDGRDVAMERDGAVAVGRASVR